MADQTVVYEFEIKLCNLEDKYWRRIEITSVSTVAKLAYAIMASFELSGSHLFSVRFIILIHIDLLEFEFSLLTRHYRVQNHTLYINYQVLQLIPE